MIYAVFAVVTFAFKTKSYVHRMSNRENPPNPLFTHTAHKLFCEDEVSSTHDVELNKFFFQLTA